MNTFELWMPISQAKPEVLDNMTWDETFRDSVRNAGLPARWLVEMDQVQKIRQARQEQMERMQKQAEMAAQADAAGKVGSVKEDSIVGRMLKDQQKAGAAGGLNGSQSNRAPTRGPLG